MHTVATVVMCRESIRWCVRNDYGILASGTDHLWMANDCYDSLLSNVVNHINRLQYVVEEWIFRKEG